MLLTASSFIIDFVVLMIVKVYDVNQITGNVLYRPMINYINKKVEDLNSISLIFSLELICFPIYYIQEAFKTFTGYENSPAVRSAIALERPPYVFISQKFFKLLYLVIFIRFDFLLQNSIFPHFRVEMPSADEMYQLCQNVS